MRIAMSFAAVLALVSAARAQVVSRVSVDVNGNEGDAASGQGRWADERAVAVSSDGNVVAFMSDASNLVPGDSNGKTDIFVFDRIAGTIERVSVDSSGAEADGASGQPALSSDGRIVAFASFATNLVAGDTNHTSDVFLHDRAAGTT
jgi:Tol biopolymer transport system component